MHDLTETIQIPLGEALVATSHKYANCLLLSALSLARDLRDNSPPSSWMEAFVGPLGLRRLQGQPPPRRVTLRTELRSGHSLVSEVDAREIPFSLPPTFCVHQRQSARRQHCSCCLLRRVVSWCAAASLLPSCLPLCGLPGAAATEFVWPPAPLPGPLLSLPPLAFLSFAPLAPPSPLSPPSWRLSSPMRACRCGQLRWRLPPPPFWAALARRHGGQLCRPAGVRPITAWPRRGGRP